MPYRAQKYALVFICGLLGHNLLLAQVWPEGLPEHIEGQALAWGYGPADLRELRLSAATGSRDGQRRYAYVQQMHRGIPIYNAIAAFAQGPDGAWRSARPPFQKGLAAYPGPQPALTAAEAWAALRPSPPRQAAPQGRLYYWPKAGGGAALAWQFVADEGSEVWEYIVDAQRGDLLARQNLVLHCQSAFPSGSAGNAAAHAHGSACLMAPNDGAAYRVWPFPLENPAAGPRLLLQNPADPDASPFGWHDTDGNAGAEYSITRGNNAHAYPDRDGDDLPGGGEPDGGAALLFDFPFDPAAEPEANLPAATVQAFYALNALHDAAWHYGFDEASGNFQANNYGRGGTEGDEVLTLVQARAEQAAGDGNRNNANFYAGIGDGEKGRMRLYVWDEGVAANNGLTVLAPASIAGPLRTGQADFGPALSAVDLTGSMALASPILGCEPLANAAELAGKIVLVERGACDFSLKAQQAQAAGALALIVANYEDAILNMSAGAFAEGIEIPVLLIKASDAARLRAAMAEGLLLRVGQVPSAGPAQLDGSIDNSLITHEFAHGISLRLSGGPNTTTCLRNTLNSLDQADGEQAGEGWSDFFALALSSQPGQNGSEARGMFTYLTREASSGQGVRNYPYSTDMSIDPRTYDDIITASVPHGVGAVFASALWDLHWALVAAQGYDADVVYGDGGNNLAIRLVMEGLKVQNCEPGMLDARDALLRADTLLSGGEHHCLIWSVFARRGMGYSAEQGAFGSRSDGREAFDLPPACSGQLWLQKRATADEAEPGEELGFELEVANYTGTAQAQVLLRDALPEGVELLPGSLSPGLSFEAGELRAEIGTLAAGERRRFSWRGRVAASAQPSVIRMREGAESETGQWRSEVLEGTAAWQRSDVLPYAGAYAWRVPDGEARADNALVLDAPLLVEGEQPVLYFRHHYLSDPAADGGVLEWSADGGSTWQDAGDLFYKNAYRGPLQRSRSFGALRPAFWGDSKGYVATHADVAALAGQALQWRFRFATDGLLGGVGDAWYVDDIMLLDARYVQSAACVSAEAWPESCAELPERGVLLWPEGFVEAPETGAEWSFSLYPNPTDRLAQVRASGPGEGTFQLSLYAVDGRLIQRSSVEKQQRVVVWPLVLPERLPAGVYVLDVRGSGQGKALRLLLR